MRPSYTCRHRWAARKQKCFTLWRVDPSRTQQTFLVLRVCAAVSLGQATPSYTGSRIQRELILRKCTYQSALKSFNFPLVAYGKTSVCVSCQHGCLAFSFAVVAFCLRIRKVLRAFFTGRAKQLLSNRTSKDSARELQLGFPKRLRIGRSGVGGGWGEFRRRSIDGGRPSARKKTHRRNQTLAQGTHCPNSVPNRGRCCGVVLSCFCRQNMRMDSHIATSRLLRDPSFKFLASTVGCKTTITEFFLRV